MNAAVSDVLGWYWVSVRAVMVPTWFVACAASVPPLAWPARGAWARRFRRPGHCPRCGYDLRASPDRCPECGEPPAPGPVATAASSGPRAEQA